MVEGVMVMGLGAASVLVCLVVLGVQVVRAERRSYTATTLSPSLGTYVMVFGASASADGPSAELEARLRMALALEDHVAPLGYVLYGGTDTVDEALVMKHYLLASGVDEDRLEADSGGDNTRASIERFARRMRHVPHQQLIAVSSGYHALRIAKQAKRCGLRVVPVAASDSPEAVHPEVHRIRLASEVLAIFFYALPDWIIDRVDTGPSSLRHRVPDWLIERQSRRSRGASLGLG